VFTLASLGCGKAGSTTVLIAFRVVQGGGAALMMAQVLTRIQRTFTGTGRARALGTYTTALSISAIVGQVLGGLIVSANIFGAEWRPVFLVNIPVGFGVAILSYSVLPGERGLKTGRLDVRGASLLAFGLLVLGVSLIYSREYQPWT